MFIKESQQDWLNTESLPTLDRIAGQETRDLVIGRRCVTISTYNDIKIYLWGNGIIRFGDDPIVVGTFCRPCGDLADLASLRPSQQITEARIVTDGELVVGFSDYQSVLLVSACTNPEAGDDDRLAWGVHFERDDKLVIGTDRRVQTISLSDASEELLEMMV